MTSPAMPRTKATAGLLGRSGLQVAGSGLYGVGQELSRISNQIDAYASEAHKNRRAEQLANLKARSDPTREIYAAEQEAKEDGSDLYKITKDRLFGWADTSSDEIKDPEVRREYKSYLLGKMPNLLMGAAKKSVAMKDQYDKASIDESLNSIYNKITLAPDSYDELLRSGEELLSAYPSYNTASARLGLKHELANTRFESIIESSNDAYELGRAKKQLESAEWRNRVDAKDYKVLRRGLEAKWDQVRNGNKAAAKAQVSSMADMTDNLHALPEGALLYTQELITSSEDPALETKLARVSRNQQLITQYASFSPEQIRAKASAIRGELNARASKINPEITAALAAVSEYPGNVPKSYLVALARVESGGELFKQSPNYDISPATSSATGLFQITKGTWLGLIRQSGDAILPGASTMTDEEVLRYRSDPGVSVKAASALTAQNKRVMERRLHRKADNTDLYLGHFFGAGTAVEFIRAADKDEDALAADLFPVEAKANRAIFYDGGDKRTMGDVYELLAGKISSFDDRVEYEDAEFMDSMATKSAARMRENIIGYAREKGLVKVAGIREKGGLSSRANAVRKISNLWDIPIDGIAPLEPSEVEHYQLAFSSDDAEKKIGVVNDLSLLGPEISPKAFEQLGEENAVYAHSAGLSSFGAAQKQSAGAIIRGQTWLDANPDAKKTMGVSKPQAVEYFGEYLTGLLGHYNGGGVGAWQATLDSAMAYYAQVYTRHGETGLDDDKFRQAIDRVLGGTAANPAVAEINGKDMLLTPSLSQEGMENFLEYADESLWGQFSESGSSPFDARGNVVPLSTLRDSATFEAIGFGRYRVQIGDDYLLSGPGSNEVYIFAAPSV